MSFVTEYSPCGHHVNKLKLVGRTKTTSDKPKSLRIWRCECGKLYMEVAGMPCQMPESDYALFIKDGMIEEISNKEN